MKKILIFSLVLFTLPLSAQHQFKAEATGGVIFTDLITMLTDDEVIAGYGGDFLFGYGYHLSGDFYYSHDIGERFYLDYGVGYSHYYFFDFTSEDYIPYLNFKVVGNYKSFIKNTDLTLGITNHFLLYQDLDGGYIRRKRFFANLDLGFCFHLGKNWDLKLTTPITVEPMNKVGLGPFGGPSKKYRVGVTGINLGLVFKFGGNKE